MPTPLTLQLIPGYVWTDNELDTAAKRNLAANPTVNLLGSIGNLALGPSAVGPGNMQPGALSADATGRAIMADYYFDSSAINKFVDGFLTAVKASESFRAGAAQFGTSVWSTLASVDTYQVTLSPAATVYTTGMRVAFKVPTANSFPVVLNVNSLGAKSLCSVGAVPLAAGQLMLHQLVEVIYDGTNFQLVNGEAMFVTTPAVITAGLTNFTHGLGQVPTRCRWVMRCVTIDGGFAVGDEVDIKNFNFTNGTTEFQGIQAGADTTGHVFVNVGNGAVLAVLNKGTQASGNITNANWNLVGYISP